MLIQTLWLWDSRVHVSNVQVIMRQTHRRRHISSGRGPARSRCSSSGILPRAAWWRFGSPHRSGHPQYTDLNKSEGIIVFTRALPLLRRCAGSRLTFDRWVIILHMTFNLVSKRSLTLLSNYNHTQEVTLRAVMSLVCLICTRTHTQMHL